MKGGGGEVGEKEFNGRLPEGECFGCSSFSHFGQVEGRRLCCYREGGGWREEREEDMLGSY